MLDFTNMTNDELITIFQNRTGQYEPAVVEKVANIIIMRYEGYVQKVVSVSFGMVPGVCRDDLLQAGRLGLFHAMKKFNPEVGVKFETYAWSQIRPAVSDEFNKAINSHSDKNYYASLIRDVKNAMAQIQDKFGTDYRPTAKEISDWINHHFRRSKLVAKSSVESALAAIKINESAPLDDIVGFAKVSDSDSVDPETYAENSVLHDAIDDALDTLTPEERYVITRKTGYYDNDIPTNDELAQELNMDPRFHRRGANRKFSAFIVDKIYFNAIRALKMAVALKPYAYEDPDQRAEIDSQTVIFQSQDEAIGAAASISEDIDAMDLPDNDLVSVGVFSEDTGFDPGDAFIAM